MSKWSIQRLLQEHLEGYRQQYGMTLHQHKAAQSLMACRTARMGSHAQYCEAGHLQGVYYNSCHHRACPQCQALSRARWLVSRESMLLDSVHHHWIFTLPHQLNPLWQFNRDWFQDALFSVVSATLKQLTADPVYLGAKPAFLLALHSWGRKLDLHPHLHCLIADGGLDEAGSWRKPKRARFLPARVMAQLVRGKLLARLRQALLSGQLRLPGSDGMQHWQNLCNKLGRINWVVHCCKPYEHGHGVAKYLARYVSGGAFQNSQLLRVGKGSVWFRYRNHRTQQRETTYCTVNEFIRRLLLHLPAPGKPMLRYYGLYHGSCLPLLNRAREHLGQAVVIKPPALDWLTFISKFAELPRCSQCDSILQSAVALKKMVH